MDRIKGNKKEISDRLLRVSAEFENYKKYMQKEMDKFKKFAIESLVSEILPIIDNLEKALDIDYGNPRDALDYHMAYRVLQEGVELTLKGLKDSLSKVGVAPMETVGQVFNPKFHHAILQEESDELPENIIIEELQRGYVIEGRLLRAPMVVISKTKDKDQ